jgi:predicted DsbA family dithiol-disulfide isomerase
VRLRRIEEEFGARVQIAWRSFLLRPEPVPGRTLEKFRVYTQSWLRPAADADAATFRVWETDAGPPSHSIPPHLAAKAAAAVSQEAFRRLHERLLHAYFAENRDITDTETLRALWREAELPEEAFARVDDDPLLLKKVIDEHREALEIGVSGVPAVRLEGMDDAIVGALPIDVYRRWVQRNLEG